MRNPDRAGQINDLMGPLQWVHGIDVARAALLAGNDERARNETFIVAGSECTTTFGLLALAWDISRPSEANPFRVSAEAKQPPRRKIDTSKIEEVLGFKPTVSLRQSVEEIVQGKEIPVKASSTVTPRPSQVVDAQAMRGKTCVISGATSGIGLASALKLGSMGARLVLIGRDRAKGEATLERLRAAVPSIEASMHYCDLLQLSDIRAVAGEILDTAPRIDVLINNAGSVFDRRELTVDGLERTFAVNHIAHFLLTTLLEERLVASAPARIITMSSWVHRGIAVDFDNLQSERSFGWVPAYKQAKLCNILFTRELSRRLSPKGVTANCIGPGPVATGIGDNLDGPGRVWFQRAKDNAAPPEAVADIVAYLAASPDLAKLSGAYLENGEPAAPSAEAQDDEAARRLWTLSARLCQSGESNLEQAPAKVRPTIRQVSRKDSRP
jgi:NAD(P)-dependent dehydrogenase (short-subunit alcohol dehydrogenase family)